MCADVTNHDNSRATNQIMRTIDFWRQSLGIYLSYKLTQAREAGLKAAGGSTEDIQVMWDNQHAYAGEQMYKLCIGLRGFYLKAGQFIGSRADFVPEAVCKKLSLLCDQVPPMSKEAVEGIICRELGLSDVSDVFEWIDLDKPLGSASIAQVHKAKLRSYTKQELRSAAGGRKAALNCDEHGVGEGEDAWDVCNLFGISLRELQQLNKGIKLDRLIPGQRLQVPLLASSSYLQPSVQKVLASSQDRVSNIRGSETTISSSSAPSTVTPSAQTALKHAAAMQEVPKDGIVAVKVQYPNAQEVMVRDLSNVRALAYYLSKTEIKFDMVSAVDELSKQIKLEFDFTREARVMDAISIHLSDVSDHVQVPRSIPGLVTRKLLVMTFLEGTPLTELGRQMKLLSKTKREMGKKLILRRLSQAYGRMILGEGLFQADGHPGNILVGKGGRIGLLDYGQSKQLPDWQRIGFARLVLALHKGKEEEICSCLSQLGIVADADPATKAEMAYGMFDTRGKVDPFDSNSPIKRGGITSFPQDMFFVLRVIQLLRGLSSGMGVESFSCVSQWVPYAEAALSVPEHKFACLHISGRPLLSLPV